MQFVPLAHLTGFAPNRVDLTAHLPWLYVITARRARIVYIGETFDQGGLIVRLGSHLGSFQQSSLRKRVAEITGISVLRPPFLIVAARLPFADDDAGYDASSKKVRLACEALLHELVGREFISNDEKWTIVSTSQSNPLVDNESIKKSCRSIYNCFETSISFLQPLTTITPFHLVLLDSPKILDETAEADIGDLIEQIEMRVFHWLLGELKREHGDRWWSEGIPVNVRIECQSRREKEAASETLPTEAYLTLIDLRPIAQKNWQICRLPFERIAEAQGKERGTKWIKELNELRKLWAHPIKRYFIPLDMARRSKIRMIHERVCKNLSEAD